MQTPMFLTTHNAKITLSVVRLYTILVVNNFVFSKVATNLFLHYKPVLKHIATNAGGVLWGIYLYIPIIPRASAFSMQICATTRTIFCNIFAVWVSDKKAFAATLAQLVKPFIIVSFFSAVFQYIAQSTTSTLRATYRTCASPIRVNHICFFTHKTCFCNFNRFWYFHIRSLYHNLRTISTPTLPLTIS